MSYIIKNPDGTDHSPISEEDLIIMAKESRLAPDDPVKKQLMRGWQKASELDFLAPVFEENKKRAENPGDVAEDSKKVSSQFDNKYIPNPGGILLRTFAALYDILLIALVALFLALLSSAVAFGTSWVKTDSSGEFATKQKASREEAWKRYHAAVQAADERAQKLSKQQGKEVTPVYPTEPQPEIQRENTFIKRMPSTYDDEFNGFSPGSVLTNTETDQKFICLRVTEGKALWAPQSLIATLAMIVMICTIIAAFFLLALPVSFRAQTPGMWFFGLFYSDFKDYTREVLAARALLALSVDILLFPLAFLCLIFCIRTPGELLTATRVIRIASKVKYNESE